MDEQIVSIVNASSDERAGMVLTVRAMRARKRRRRREVLYAAAAVAGIVVLWLLVSAAVLPYR